MKKSDCILEEIKKKHKKKAVHQVVRDEVVKFLKARGLEVKTEHKFHPKSQWRFDIVILPNIAIEIHGGLFMRRNPIRCPKCKNMIFSKGFEGTGHTHPTNLKKNLDKQNNATKLGWQMLIYTTDQFKTAGDYYRVYRDIQECQK